MNTTQRHSITRVLRTAAVVGGLALLAMPNVASAQQFYVVGGGGYSYGGYAAVPAYGGYYAAAPVYGGYYAAPAAVAYQAPVGYGYYAAPAAQLYVAQPAPTYPLQIQVAQPAVNYAWPSADPAGTQYLGDGSRKVPVSVRGYDDRYVRESGERETVYQIQRPGPYGWTNVGESKSSEGYNRVDQSRTNYGYGR